jgi:putative phage-type endonuclease
MRIELEQGTPEWLTFRETKIGASDAPIIMGVSPWCTPYQLWERKLRLKEAQTMTPAMARGHAMEAKAREQLELHFGIVLKPGVIQSDVYEWQMASLDAISEDGSIVIEIKCPGKDDHSSAASAKVPMHYAPQLQHIMAVTGAQKMFYFSYSDDSSHLLEVDRDNNYITEMIRKERTFYSCMMNLTPPELCGKDTQSWDPSDEDNVRRLVNLLEYRKLIEDEISSLQRHLKSKLTTTTVGYGLKAYFIKERGTVDYSSIPELASINLDKYRRFSMPTWGFKLEE